MENKVEEKRFVGDRKFLTYAGTPGRQGAMIYGELVKAGEVTLPQLVKIVERLKFQFRGAATAESCARAWLRQFINIGIAHAVGEAPKKLTAKPHEAPKPKVGKAKANKKS